MNGPEPVEDFYYGLGLVIAVVITTTSWAMCKFIFDIDANPGIFSGTIIMGLFYMWRGIKNGRRA